MKRPLSLIFIILYSAGFILAVAITASFAIDFTDFLYGFLIIIAIFSLPPVILFLILFIKNFVRKIRKRALWFGIGTLICIVLAMGGFLSTGLIADQFARAQKNFGQKKYETAIKYYDSVIEDNKDSGLVETSNAQKQKATGFIDEAKRLVKNGNIFLEYGLYGRAEEEYLKASDIYPLLEDIKQKLKNICQLKAKFGESAAEQDYVLFNEGLKFNYDTMFPQWWGKVKVCDPKLAEFRGFTLEEGQFYKSENMLKVSGKLEGLKQMDQYIESSEGLFTFISAYVVNNDGSVRWYKDGYLSGESPYLIEGQVRDFTLVSQLTVSLEPEDWLVIIAYVKSSMIIMTDNQASEGPNGDRNAFAVYWAQIKDI
jgi:hypothetical protein